MHVDTRICIGKIKERPRIYPILHMFFFEVLCFSLASFMNTKEAACMGSVWCFCGLKF